MAREEELIQAARNIAAAAYAPYSGCFVGAAILFSGSDIIYAGCNVENSSYGLTICAERSAACAGISAKLKQIDLVAIAVLNKQYVPVQGFMPCGACRQFLAEFSTDKTRIIVDNYGTWLLSELLPHAFRLSDE